MGDKGKIGNAILGKIAFTNLGNSRIISRKGDWLYGNAHRNAEIVETNGNEAKLLGHVQGIRQGPAHHQEDVRAAHLPGTNEHSVNFEDNFSLILGISKNPPLSKG